MQDVTKWLTKHEYFWINIKTMGTFDPRLGIYRPSPHTTLGCSDLLVIKDSCPVFIELKRPKGGKQSPDQRLFEKRIKAEGCEYYLVNGIKKLESIFP